MKKTKYPELEEDIIKANSVTFRFSGGDLWFRDNVSKFDDLSHCIDQMRESILNHPGKINNFVWYISYFLPDSEQLKKLKNVKYIFCDKDKLARYNPENPLLNNLEIDKSIFILNETGHFPFFEDPEQLESIISKALMPNAS